MAGSKAVLLNDQMLQILVEELKKENEAMSDILDDFLQVRKAAKNVVYSAQGCDKNFVYVKREHFEKLKEFFE